MNAAVAAQGLNAQALAEEARRRMEAAKAAAADAAARALAAKLVKPSENRILAEPATQAACRRDYAAGADVRAAAAKQQARKR